MLTTKWIESIESQREGAVVSHISRKTSEMWSAPAFVWEPGTRRVTISRQKSAQARPANCLVSVSTLIFSPSLIKHGNANLNARFQFGWLGYASARRVSTDRRFGRGDSQFHLGRQL